LHRRTASGAWVTIATARTTKATRALGVAAGAPYRFSVKPTKKAARYRVVIAADAGRVQAISVTRTVR
jgi:hypothetical protein